MSYIRVIPRDLFNEANLLKCMGKLAILLDINRLPEGKFPTDYVDSFDVVQDPSDGSLSVENLPLIVRGKPHRLFRTLNSRDEWPLWLRTPDEDIPVFSPDGLLSLEMLEYLRK